MLAIIEQAAASDTGLHRHANEDSFLVSPPVFVVADGMGGAQAGEVASQLAVETFHGELGSGRPEELLRQRVEAANGQIHRLARTDPSLAGMGTTLTAAVVVPDSDEVVVGHVGDSRIYRLRGDSLEQLTRDHSLVEEMRRKGQITDEQAESHPQRSIITRALGPEPIVQVDVQTVAAVEGDLFLLCSDGLTTMLDDGRIKTLLLGATSLEAAAKALIAEANRAGGRDNITVVLFRLGGEGGGPVAGSRPGPRSGGATAVEPVTMIGGAARAEGLDANRIRAAATPSSRQPERRWPKRLLKTGIALALLAVVALAAIWGARQVWFLGTDAGGRVALYQGLPYELPFGIDLYSERYSIPIQTSSLPARRQEVVTGHALRSKQDAVSLIDDILVSQAPKTSETTEPAEKPVEPPAKEKQSGSKKQQGAKQKQGTKQQQGGSNQRNKNRR
jgi:serine/threonine protein phosphatase PrpC